VRTIRFGRSILALGLVLVVAGCGVQQVQPNVKATPTIAPIPTVAPTPTLTVLGGSTAAIVNGQSIPMSRFKDLLHYIIFAYQQQGQAITLKDAAQTTIAQLIENQVMNQQAAKRGITVSKADIDKKIAADIKSTPGGKTAFETRLKQAGITESDLRYLILYGSTGLIQAKLTTAAIPLQKSGSIATGRHILIEAREPASSNPVVRVFHPPLAPTVDKCAKKILTDAEAETEAKHLLSEINHGSSFATLAKKCSDDTGSGATGGALVGPSNSPTLYPYAEGYVAPFENALFTGPVGKPYLIHSQFGWHILEVTGRHNGPYPVSVKTATGTVNVRSAIQQGQFQSWITQKAEGSNTQILESVK
jgi:parvulin-like peptidyl-prolyl isomerase